ncbi:type IV pilus modification protein PilV [Comamonas sp. JUb58]|nr:type IV pilus modification protein PilV [Comamonas sp. JUb58]
MLSAAHCTAPRRIPGRRPQRGVMLIEAMVSILLLLLGILGIAGLTAKSTALSGQAQYRTEAGMYAEQVIQLVSLSVDRSSPSALAQSLKAFEHQPDGTERCTYSGTELSESSDLGKVLKAARGDPDNHVLGLPGATESGQQVVVETDNHLNRVTVRLCWQGPSDAAKRIYEIQAFVH